MATTINYGTKFTAPIVVRPLMTAKPDLTLPGEQLNSERTSISLEAGVYVFEFTDTNLPPIAKTVSGTGTLDVAAVIP